MAIRQTAGQAVDDFAHGRAERDLEHARMLYIAADAHEFRADRLADTIRQIALVLIAEQVRHEGQALDVVEAGRAGEQAADLDERRFHARPAGLALDGADEGCALAADIGSGT